MVMRIAVFAMIAVLGAVFILVEPAFAWGPSTHLFVGRGVLGQVSGHVPALSSILAAHPLDFLYGSIFADMSLGKKFLMFSRMAHNWRVGLALKESAETDEQLACSYGYLAHLAADTVAHTEYVPKKLVEHYKRRGRGHIFLEGRFDTKLPDKGIHKFSKEVIKVGSANNDEFLENSLTRTLFSFQTNRLLYRGILTFHRSNGVQLYRRYRSKSDDIISPAQMEDYLERTIDTVIDFLNHGRSSEPYAKDPHGKKIIKQATRLRHRLRAHQRHGGVTSNMVKDALDQVTLGPRRGV